MRGLSRNFKGVIQLKFVNETITSKAYQDNIKNDIKLQYESRVNILKRYCKVCCLVECLGYSAFIYKIYIEIGLEYGFEKMTFSQFTTMSNPLGPFNCFAVLFVPTFWPFLLQLCSYYVASNLNTQNALKISLNSNYVKLYYLCNLLLHIHQSQSSDSLLIH